MTMRSTAKGAPITRLLYLLYNRRGAPFPTRSSVSTKQGGKRPGEARDISGDSSVEGRVGWRRGSAALVARSRKKRRNKRETRHLTNNTTESFSLVVVRFVC
jgi:hypothetical protein